MAADRPRAPIDRFFGAYCRLLEAVLALGLAAMVILVFGNVVLRYAFNDGITVSEELSRWIFVWMTYLGAVVALHERGHLGTDVLLDRLPARARTACLALAHLAMIGVCVLMLQGSIEQTRINWNVQAPSSGASVAIFYAAGIVFAVSALVMLTVDLLRLLSGDAAAARALVAAEGEA